MIVKIFSVHHIIYDIDISRFPFNYVYPFCHIIVTGKNCKWVYG